MSKSTPKTTSGVSTQAVYCQQVSKRKASYEAKMLTQQSLLELGKKMSTREDEAKSMHEKHTYLMSATRELDKFDGNVFMTEYEKTKDLNLLKAKSYSLVRYISIFKELHNSNVSEIVLLKAKVGELESDITDQSDQIDSYIEQLDATDITMEGRKTKIIEQRCEISRLKDQLRKSENSLVSWKSSSCRYKSTFAPLLILLGCFIYAYLFK